MAYSYKITVFTPTYNRAHLIGNLYRSLQRQTFLDFEWLVVDDGSSDGTGQLFSQWRQEDNPFPIRYYRQENGGKCRAINHALPLARGELFFTVDSDDYLTDDALAKVAVWESEIPKNPKYCGFAGNLGTAPGVTPNKRFDGEFLDGSALDRYGAVDGERAMIFYTEIHRRYPYPEFPGEKFMTEAVAWNRMAGDGYKMRFYNDIIWIYEYNDDGLTRAGMTLFQKNPQGFGLWLREKAEFFHFPLWKKLVMWLGFLRDLDGLYPVEQIAGFIGMPYPVAVVLKQLRKLKQFLKK